MTMNSPPLVDFAQSQALPKHDYGVLDAGSSWKPMTSNYFVCYTRRKHVSESIQRCHTPLMSAAMKSLSRR